jgi:hypothetical protein
MIEWIKEGNYTFAIFNDKKIGKITFDGKICRFKIYGTKTIFNHKYFRPLQRIVEDYVDKHKLKMNILFPLIIKGYIRDAVYSIETILPLISTEKKKVKLGELEVNCNSIRLNTFKEKGLKCVKCGIEGSYFAIEHTMNEKPHLNLYAVNDEGKEVLMTKDHMIPVSKGGKDHIDNMQTMCKYCNEEKDTRIEIYL